VSVEVSAINKRKEYDQDNRYQDKRNSRHDIKDLAAAFRSRILLVEKGVEPAFGLFHPLGVNPSGQLRVGAQCFGLNQYFRFPLQPFWQLSPSSLRDVGKPVALYPKLCRHSVGEGIGSVADLHTTGDTVVTTI